MPKLRNARHERFVMALAEGKTAKVAYSGAGFRSTGNATDVNASRLQKNPAVKARLAELQQKHARKVEVTVESLVAELDEMRRKAIVLKQLSAGVQAIMGKAKLLGLITDKVDMDATLRRPMREPGEVKRMSLAEWQEKFAPKLIEGERKPDPPKHGNSDLN
jgi:phage terminase small subunit